MIQYSICNLCPRQCMVDRNNNTGICGVTSELKVARSALHFWEEPCISGTKGSGTVFFSGCSLHCVFCQNQAISGGRAGKVISKERLSEIFLELEGQGANNINLVTPGHYVPQIIWSVEQARREGLKLPIVYNTGGYEKVDTLKQLEGIVDVYLPDFKFWSPEVAAKYAKAPDYPQVVRDAIEEMVRQKPRCYFAPEQDKENGEEIMTAGVMVRQLLLPGQLPDAKKILKYLHETYGNRIYLSMMSQYTPLAHVETYPELNRKVGRRTYDKYIDYAIGLGIEQGFFQEGDVAEDSFIPAFDGEGV